MISALGIYFLKSTIVSGIFYLIFWLFFKRESFFKLNRFYLISSLLFAYSFPFISIPVSETTVQEIPVIASLQSSVNHFAFIEETPATVQQPSEATMNFDMWIWLVLGAITAIFLFRFIKHIIQLHKTIQSHETIKEPDYTLVLFNRKNTFSFFRYIFISPFVRNSPDGTHILAHELSHLKHLHSLDRLIIELLNIVFWMNPFIYLYRKELEEVHEYQADRDANQTGDSLKSYFELVLRQASDSAFSPLMSPFSYQLIKKRIIMSTHKSNPLRKLVLLLPFLLSVIILTTSAIKSSSFAQDISIQKEKKVYKWPDANQAADISAYKIFDAPEDNTQAEMPAKAGNVHTILINSKGQLLMEGQKALIEEVKPAVVKFLTSRDNSFPEFKTKDIPLLGKQTVNIGMISLQRDRSTPNSDADNLLNEVIDAYNEVRDNAAIKHFSKPFTDCSEQEQKAIIQLYPHRISIAPPKNRMNQKTDTPTSTGFILPIDEANATRIMGYGYRIHPIYKVKKLHQGMDLKAELNTPVYASQSGKVSLIKSEKTGYGKRIELEHDNNYKTLYAHLNSFNVKDGETVQQGEIIGYVGNTGASTAPHLHFELHKEDKAINPQTYLAQLNSIKTDQEQSYGGSPLFTSPLKGKDLIKTSSGYGMRVHPIKKVKMMHNGTDYVGPVNANILAIGDGVVRTVSSDFVEGKGYGRYVIIDHENGYSSLYAQLNAYKVKEGQTIKQGDVIGLLGSSGLSTAPHLHLEIKKDDQHIDPETVIK